MNFVATSAISAISAMMIKGGGKWQQQQQQQQQLRRIQISPFPVEPETEQAVVYQSPAFTFADSGGWPGANRKYGPDARMLSAGRAVKAEVKLMVKTADVGKEAIEIRSIREFVELDPAGSASAAAAAGGGASGGPGPFSRIFLSENQASSGPVLPASGPHSPPPSPPPLPANHRNRSRLLVTPIHPSALGKPLHPPPSPSPPTQTNTTSSSNLYRISA